MKTAITFMVLVSVCGGLLLPKCQPDHNDCSCNDKSFKDCQQPTAEQEESVENLEQCLAKLRSFQLLVSVNGSFTNQQANVLCLGSQAPAWKCTLTAATEKDFRHAEKMG